LACSNGPAAAIALATSSGADKQISFSNCLIFMDALLVGLFDSFVSKYIESTPFLNVDYVIPVF
jgi:hypothetical protein